MNTKKELPGKWRIEGFDTFEGEGNPDAFYPIPGEYDTKEEAEEAARKRVAENHKDNPGAGEIQDMVYIIDPDGDREFFDQ